MTKNIFQKGRVLALGLALTMAMSNVALASGAGTTQEGSTSIPMTTSLKAPVFNIVVPTGVPLVMDPYQLGPDKTSSFSLYAADFGFWNKSNVPVRIDLSPSLTLATGVYQATPAEVALANLDINSTNKLFSMQMLAATSDGLELTTTFQGLSVGALNFASPDAFNVVPGKVLAGKRDANVVFALDKAEVLSATGMYVPADDKVTPAGAAAVTFRGAVNSNAKWASTDIKVAMKITLKGISVPSYVATTPLEAAHRVVEGISSDVRPVAYIMPSSDAFAPAGSDYTAIATVGDGSLKATSVTITLQEQTTKEVYPFTLTTDYTVTANATAGTLSLKILGAAGKKLSTLPAGTYNIIVQFNDGLMTTDTSNGAITK